LRGQTYDENVNSEDIIVLTALFWSTKLLEIRAIPIMQTPNIHLQEFLAINPQILEENISDLKLITSDDAVADEKFARYDAANSYCGLVWVRDSGSYAVMKATRAVSIIVTNTRNGRYVSEGMFHLKIGDTISLLQNNDGQNYDGYRC